MKVTVAAIHFLDNTTRLFATGLYVTAPGDSPPNTACQPYLRSMEYEMACGAWWWGQTSGPAPFSELRFMNPDRRLDNLIDIGVDRDVPVQIWEVEQDAALSTGTLIGSPLPDRMLPAGMREIRLTMRSRLAKLDLIASARFDDSTPNEAIRGQAIPVCLGLVRWISPALFDETNRDWAITDAQIYGITGSIYDRGSAVLADYSPACVGYRRTTAAVGKQAVAVNGQVIRSGAAVLGSVGDFDTDDGGGYPDGWTVTEDKPTATIEWLSPGRCRGYASSGYAEIELPTALTSGTVYGIEIAVHSYVGGVCNVVAGGLSFAIRGAGLHQRCFAASTTSVRLRFEPSSGDASFVLDHVRIWTVSKTDTVAGMVRWAAARAGIEADLHAGDMAALELIGAPVGYASNGDVSASAVFWAALNSVGATAYEDRDGKIRLGVIEPATEPEVVASFTERDIVGGIDMQLDDAAALTNRIAYGANYAPHGDSDIVDGAAGPVQELKQARRESASVVVVRDRYAADIQQRPAHASVFVDQEDALAELDRVLAFYTGADKDPRFVRFEVLGTHTIRPRDVVRVAYPAYGMATPRIIRVLYAKNNSRRGRCVIRGWWVP